MSVTRKLSKCGNSTAVIIPPVLLEQLGWKVGDTEVEIDVQDGKLIIAAEKPKRLGLFRGKP